MFSSRPEALHLVLAELLGVHLFEQFGPFVPLTAFGGGGGRDGGLGENRFGYQDARSAAKGEGDGIAGARVHVHALPVSLDMKEGEVCALADLCDLDAQESCSGGMEDRL